MAWRRAGDGFGAPTLTVSDKPIDFDARLVIFRVLELTVSRRLSIILSPPAHPFFRVLHCTTRLEFGTSTSEGAVAEPGLSDLGQGCHGWGSSGGWRTYLRALGRCLGKGLQRRLGPPFWAPAEPLQTAKSVAC
jgi:hypothetical protein